jgi:hypothetical protein
MESWLINETDIFNNILVEEELNLNDINIFSFKKLDGYDFDRNNSDSIMYDIILINNINKFEIKLNKLSNLNKFLDSTIMITSSSKEIYFCSIRLLVFIIRKNIKFKNN